MGKGSHRHIGGKPKSRQRKQKPAFHIFCEGQNTEPLYFNKFQINNIAYCKGYAEPSLNLVEIAIKYKRRKNITEKTIDQFWVVFDYDYDIKKQPKQKEAFNKAIIKAEQNNIKWAVSNDAFELWYVLHFENCQAQEPREWYNKRLKHHIKEPYDKNRKTAMKMYDLVLSRQSDAIERAEKLMLVYDDEDKAYADKNPFTTVHKLVKELNRYV